MKYFPRSFCCLLLIAISSLHTARAGISERTGDTRTSVPELVAKDNLWGAKLSTGGTLLSGNVNVRQVYGDTAVFKQWENWIAYIEGNGFFSASGDPLNHVHNQTVGRVRVDYKLSEVFRIFAFSTQGYNEFTKLNYRGTYGIGPWFQLKAGAFSNGFSVAPVLFRENFKSTGLYNQTRLSIRDVFTVGLSDTSTFGVDTFYSFPFGDGKDFRISTSPFLEADILKKILALKIMAVLERDMKPEGGVKTNDLSIVSALTFTIDDKITSDTTEQK